MTELDKQSRGFEERPIRFTDGTHMVGIYTIENNVLNAVIPFFVEGLKNNERCFYAAPPETLVRVKDAFEEEGINVGEAEKNGQLIFLGDKSPLLNGGRFDPGYLVNLYREDVDRALAEGWKHVRATAEMSWLIEGEAGREEILYYEALSTELFNNTDKVHALCQYNTARMSGTEIIELLKIHPWALMDGRVGENPYWIDPEPAAYSPVGFNVG